MSEFSVLARLLSLGISVERVKVTKKTAIGTTRN